MHQIKEDDLENLEYFSEFGKLIADKSDTKDASKPRLIFLVRDWRWPHEFSYGDVGGEDYVRKQLQVQEEENQKQELKKIRQNLRGGFLEIGGFLLPYPGTDVSINHQYDGKVKDIDKEFLKYVELLVPYVVSEKKLTTKRMNCKDVKGKDMLVYIKNYVKFVKDGDYDTLKTAVEVIAKEQRYTAFKQALNVYEDDMEKFFETWTSESLDDLKKHHTHAKKNSIEEFTDCPRIKVEDHEQKSLRKLKQKIKDKYDSYEKRASAIAEEQRNTAFQTAYKMYEDEMETYFERRNYLSLDDLMGHHTNTKKTSLNKFTDCPRLKVEEQEQLFRTKLEQKIEDKYPSYKNRAYVIAKEQRNTAFQTAYNVYEDKMEEFFERWNCLSLDDLMEYHTLAKNTSLNEFMNYPRIRLEELDEEFRTRLEQKIEDKYPPYLNRAYAITTEKRNSAFQIAYYLYENEMQKLFETNILVTQGYLNNHHRLTKEKSLNKFTVCPRIKVVDLEQTSLEELGNKIEEMYPSYEERTIEMKLADCAAKIVVPGSLIITPIAGVLGGRTVLICTGGALTMCYLYALNFRKRRN